MRRITRYEQICLSILILIGAPLTLSARISEQEAIEVVKRTPCVQEFASDSRLVRVLRNEELEDDLFALQVKQKNQIVKDAYVFRITNSGTFILSPDEWVNVTLTGKKYLLFAVVKESGNAYPLYGCANQTANFSQLIKEVSIGMNSESDADVFALLFYTLTMDPERERLVITFRQFRHFVEDAFFSWFSDNVAELNFRKWAATDGRLEKISRIGILSQKKASGFRSSVTFAIGERGSAIKLEALRIDFNEKGEILNSTSSTVLSVKKISTGFQSTIGK
ncbi:MAG: hypothetical protein ACKVRN_11345 [Pyrinomonadaceae bacterium]